METYEQFYNRKERWENVQQCDFPNLFDPKTNTWAQHSVEGYKRLKDVPENIIPKRS